jgi:hypothetical protein
VRADTVVEHSSQPCQHSQRPELQTHARMHTHTPDIARAESGPLVSGWESRRAVTADRRGDASHRRTCIDSRKHSASVVRRHTNGATMIDMPAATCSNPHPGMQRQHRQARAAPPRLPRGLAGGRPGGLAGWLAGHTCQDSHPSGARGTIWSATKTVIEASVPS